MPAKEKEKVQNPIEGDSTGGFNPDAGATPAFPQAEGEGELAQEIETEEIEEEPTGEKIPSDAKEKARYYFEKRQEAKRKREEIEKKLAKLAPMEGLANFLEATYGSVEEGLRAVSQAPAERPVIGQEKPKSKLEQLMERMPDMQNKELLKELTDAIREDIEQRSVRPAIMPLYEHAATQEEMALAAQYNDPETGFEVLKPRVKALAQSRNISLPDAYAIVSRPLIEEKLRKVLYKENVKDEKRRMQSVADKGGGREASIEPGELTLDAEQKFHAERLYPDLPSAEAHKKFLAGLKAVYPQRSTRD